VRHRQVLLAVQEYCRESPPDLQPMGHAVFPLQLPGWPETRIVRLYEPRKMRPAIRHLCAKALVSRNDVQVPVTLCHGPVTVGPQQLFAILEARAPGAHPTQWSPQLGQWLGQDMAKWHGTRIPPWAARAIGVSLHEAKVYRRSVARRSAHLQVAHGTLLQELDRSLRALESADMRGPVALSHGDLHNHNCLVQPSGGLVWLDLDGVCRRPWRHDLALAELRLLCHSPQAIEAFEEQYFGVYPAQQEGWIRHRLDWFRMASSWWALQALTPRKRPPALRRQERARLAISSACWEVADIGQPSGVLMAEILRLAEQNPGTESPAQ
jgi:Ser/Thr protein kinase RdoA (MazF antagonist)